MTEDDLTELFRPLTREEIEERIRIVRDAKRAKSAICAQSSLTPRELTELLGPPVETFIHSLGSARKNMAIVKIENFGVIGVKYMGGQEPFLAKANSGNTRRTKRCKTLQEAIDTRNEWARELWPGCPEALCDEDAAYEKWGHLRGAKRRRPKVEGRSTRRTGTLPSGPVAGADRKAEGVPQDARDAVRHPDVQDQWDRGPLRP